MSHLVIGTAGHIDHGKTTLVKALTGTDTDRLKEEKERGITIELGFAHLALPSGCTVGLIDVPGHERFIKNMLSGVAGIDIALLVIASDEGIMPQTREHFDILCLLGIRELIVVISKAEMADRDILDLVREDVNGLLSCSSYADAPVLEVSALTGQGISQLLGLLDQVTRGMKTASRQMAFTRLPVDRVFTLPGFGTITTGTLFNGTVAVGDILEIPAKKSRARVRNVQVHNVSVPQAVAGQRVAMNLAGIATQEIERGDVLATPDWLIPTTRLDVSFHLLKHAVKELTSQTRIRFQQGTKETLGRVYLLGPSPLAPGQDAFLQIVLEEPAVVVRGDNFIVRSYSPVHTIGGGRIIEPVARKHKKKEINLRQELEIKAAGSRRELTLLYLQKERRFATEASLARYLGVAEEETIFLLKELLESGSVVQIQTGDQEKRVISSDVLKGWRELANQRVWEHLEQYPLEPGLNKETLRVGPFAGLTGKEFNALISYWVQQGQFDLREGQYICPIGHQPRIGDFLSEKIRAVEKRYEAAQWQIPGWEPVKKDLRLEDKKADQILQYLIRNKHLVLLSEDLYINRELLQQGIRKIKEWFAGQPELTVAQARDFLGASRKITVPFLEYLDKHKYTLRSGDVRKWIGKE